MSETAVSLQSKTGKARAVTASEVLQSDSTLSPAATARLRQLLLASWDSLPIGKRNELIQYRWEQVGGAEFLPILRTIVASEPNRNHDMDKFDRGAALRRIYELTPDHGRELILREVAAPKGDIDSGVLGMLSDRELPQLDQSLVANLQGGTGSDLEFQLVARYASQRVLPLIKAVYEPRRGAWACNPQTAMLQYFVRVNRDYGIAEVHDALGRRQKTGCYKSLFSSLDENLSLPRIEAIAMDALNDTSVEVAIDAAQSLGRYGSKKAEAALWSRLEKLHEQNPNQADQIPHRTNVQTQDLLWEIRLEQVLVQAIANGQAWFAGEDTIQRLKQLATPQEQPELDGILTEIQNATYFLSLNWWPQGTLSYTVGRYNGKGIENLKEKLSQFSPGAHLQMVTTINEKITIRASLKRSNRRRLPTGCCWRLKLPDNAPQTSHGAPNVKRGKQVPHRRFAVVRNDIQVYWGKVKAPIIGWGYIWY